MAEPILTAAETHAAERALFATGTDPLALMERAGRAVADAIAARLPIQEALVACGPGNNGGDGYVVARLLAERGWPVTVAALADPATPSAVAMRARWTGPVAPPDMGSTPPLLIDALFGIGARAIDPALGRWLDAAPTVVAVDVPSGLDTDTGAARGRTAAARFTVALGALKPVHVLTPGAALCGEMVVAPLGLPMPDRPCLVRIAPPALRPPDWTSHKYNRGKVAVIAGDMAGATHLAAMAAQRAGAGYVELIGDALPLVAPFSIVRRPWSPAVLADERLNAVVIGPGLGADRDSRARLAAVLDAGRPVVLDAGALPLLRLPLAGPAVLTPHAGEFERLFGPLGGNPLAAVRAAARQANAVVLLKGAASIVAHPDGRAAVAPLASPWLATAGTGDVLAGILGAMLAQAGWHGYDLFEATQAAVWLHARAAERTGPGLIADDLLFALKTAIAKA